MKKTAKLLCAIAVPAFLMACTQTETAEPKPEAEANNATPASWGYGESDGPEKWGDLSEDYAPCKNGKEQSPVDLPAADSANLVQVSTNYGSASADVVDKGKTLQADFAKGFSLTSGENSYDLVQVHFHTPSENTVSGKAYPLTAHFVHADADDNLAVLGVFYEEGEANPALQTILDGIGSSASLNAAAMIPEQLDVYNFRGSLTTPPCTEGVNWHVISTPMSASSAQIEAFRAKMGNNARPVQPANARTF